MRDNTKKNYMNTDLSLVVDAYIHGLLAVHPKKRYTPGNDARYIWIPLSYLPSFISDFVMSYIMLKPISAMYKGM